MHHHYTEQTVNATMGNDCRTRCRQNSEHFNVTAGETHSNHWAIS